MWQPQVLDYRKVGVQAWGWMCILHLVKAADRLQISSKTKFLLFAASIAVSFFVSHLGTSATIQVSRPPGCRL